MLYDWDKSVRFWRLTGQMDRVAGEEKCGCCGKRAMDCAGGNQHNFRE